MPNATPSSDANPEDNAVLTSADRRAADRLQTVFRVCRIITAQDEGIARIRNISDWGAGLRMPIPVCVSDSVALELVDGVALRGQVIWARGEEFGLQFDQPIDSAELLAALAVGARCGITRPVRLPIFAAALTRSERGLRKVQMVDISQRGLKLVHDGSLTEGLRLKVTLPCGLDRPGVVRWTRDDRAGVLLLEPLSVEMLGSARSLMAPALPLLGRADAAGLVPR